MYVGVFLLGVTMGALFMAFVAGANMGNQCEDCRGDIILKEKEDCSASY